MNALRRGMVVGATTCAAACGAFGIAPGPGGDDAGLAGEGGTGSDADPADGQIGAADPDAPMAVDFDAGASADVMASPAHCDASDQCSAPATCDQGVCEKLVFVTSIATTGSLAGLAHADTICQALATAASLNGRYLAWLSTSTMSPDIRFLKSERAYVRPDGVKVATSFASLGALLNPISVTEKNLPRPGVRVRTATDPQGRFVSNGVVGDCAGYSSATMAAANVFGLSDAVGSQWTYAQTYWCSEAQALYCFEQ